MFAAVVVVAAAGAAGSAAPEIGARAAAARDCAPPHVVQAKERPITSPRWLRRTLITEYWPTPEGWFVGAKVRAPGVPGRHHVDWLYGSRGLPMEGEGLGADGRLYRFLGPYGTPWVNAYGTRTRPCASGFWTHGKPFWLDFGWRNSWGGVTFPLAGGGWWDRRAVRVVPPPSGMRFGVGKLASASYWRTAAVDPRLIPLRSRVFAPALCGTPGRGWVLADDTGGAIVAHHIDVFRPPPALPSRGHSLRGQLVFVVPPGTRPERWPRCRVHA